MKIIPGNLLKKPGKIMKISWNFVSPRKWEPWCKGLLYKYILKSFTSDIIAF